MSFRPFPLHFCFALAALLTGVANAGELRQTYRSARVQAMGGAYTALADGEEAIFMNPAGLVENKGYTFNYMAADLAISSDVIIAGTESSSAFSSPSGDTLNVLMGKNISTSAQLSPSLTGPGMGLAFLVDQQFSVHTENKSLPQVTLGYQTTNGFQIAYATSIGKTRRGILGKGSDLRVGVAGKIMNRRGGYRKIPPITLFQLSPEKAKELIGAWGMGYGIDFGSQYVFRPNKRLTLMAGLSVTDLGDTNFGDGPDPIKSVMSAGFGAQYQMGLVLIRGAYDMRHIMHVADWRKKNHFGLEIGLPIVSLYAGINQVYLTYGAGFNAWLFHITAASYVEEQGSFVYQDPERRYQMKIAMKFDF